MAKKNKRTRAIQGALGAFAVVFGLIFLWWFLFGQFREWTDDAYVQGNLIEVTPLVPGIVTSIHTDATQKVQQGHILVSLDRTDYEIGLEKAKAQLALAVRQVSALFEKAEQIERELAIKEAELLRAYVDHTDRKTLRGTGAISEEDIIHAETALMSAQAAYQAKKHEYFAVLAKVENTDVASHPKVLEAKEKVKQAFVNLSRCQIYAPNTGIIAQRSLQVGQSVSSKDQLLAVIPLDQIWVDANFKETQLKHMRPGQKVTLKADLYGSGVIFDGKIVGINGGTGAVFSILPPQNATGNWIKIVQRVPVRIALDPKQVDKYPLFPGLSMKVTVDTSRRDGDFSIESKTLAPQYVTSVFAQEELGVDVMLAEIIEENLFIREEDGSSPWPQ